MPAHTVNKGNEKWCEENVDVENGFEILLMQH